MKSLRLPVALTITILFLPFQTRAVESKPPAALGQFDQFRTLLGGEWEATGSDGHQVRAWYRLVSAGTTLLETFKTGDEPEMITAYHIDKDDLMMTHYCSAGNQPTMRVEPPGKDPKVLNFSFVSATNLPDPEIGHMIGLTVTFKDQDHFMENWTWHEKGKDKAISFPFSRKKGGSQVHSIPRQ